MSDKATLTEKLVEAPADYEELKSAIAGRYASLSRQLQSIARFALENPNDIALETVATIAKRAGVQPSSMVRFAQTMGYDGFTTMQQVFRSRLMAGAVSYRDRIRSMAKDRGEGPESLLDDFVDEGMASLQALRDSIDRPTIAAAADRLVAAEEVFLLAQRRAFPVAFYLAYALGRLEKRYRLLDGTGGLMHQQAAQARPSDTILAISFTPYSQDVIDIARERSEAGVPIVGITDSPLSPLAMAASVSFEVPDQGDQPFRSLVAPLCLAQTLMVTVGQKMAERENNRGDSP
ncbi:MurR/RpiR family transcriptional regulator [Pelagibius marinus]|uniref:MurR/RpiR family transcriptional regulator n=1 Tax=Pelagibius marinus TaxID=2762760 RepID=UPI00187294D8|nr:MurR/RpiR family transcriptional regulator [Pelagibius marinus]